MKKLSLIEILKVIFSFIVALLIIRFVLEVYISKGAIDIHFHDTYLVIIPIHLIIIITVPTYYLIQFLHLIFLKKINHFSFSIFCIAFIGLIFISYQIASIFKLFENGYTSYPSLSNFEINYYEKLDSLFSFPFIFIIILIFVPFILICIKFGIQNNKTT